MKFLPHPKSRICNGPAHKVERSLLSTTDDTSKVELRFTRRPSLLRRILDEALRSLTVRLWPLEWMKGVPDLFVMYRDLTSAPGVERAPGGWLYRGKFYPDYLTMGGAVHAITREALRYCRGRGVDLGAGLWPLPGAMPVDVSRGPGVGRTAGDFERESLDFLFSSHCLEHVAAWREVLAQWVTKVKPQGVVFLYLPHPECEIWHPGTPFVGDGHKWTPTPAILKDALAELGCETVEFDDGPDAMRSFYVCARKVEAAPQTKEHR